jgi:hypothetical protein
MSLSFDGMVKYDHLSFLRKSEKRKKNIVLRVDNGNLITKDSSLSRNAIKKKATKIKSLFARKDFNSKKCRLHELLV